MLKLPERQHGYIGIVLLILLLLTIAVIFPVSLPDQAKPNPLANIITKGCHPVTNGGTISAPAYSRGGNGQETVTIDPNDKADYKLILTNAFVRTSYINGFARGGSTDNGGIGVNFNNKILLGGQYYLILYPKKHGELHLSGNKNGNQIIMSDYRLIFLARLANGSVQTLDGKDIGDGYKGIFMITDVYQQEGATPIPDIAIKECQGLNKKDLGNLNVNQKPELYTPDQNISPEKDQLQLQYFLVKTPPPLNTAGAWQVHCKPAIYLYPQRETEFLVKVNTKGYLTYTLPKYLESGWQGKAYPNGQVEVAGIKYPYLYYESKIRDELIKIPEQGVVTQFQTLSNSFDYLLPKLGLDQQQIADFKQYWIKTLPYSPYYFVGVMPQQSIDFLEPLEITPKPDLSVRVRLYFQPLNYKPDQLPKLPDFNSLIATQTNSPGFKMVEWGGMVKMDKNHPFTCSQ